MNRYVCLAFDFFPVVVLGTAAKNSPAAQKAPRRQERGNVKWKQDPIRLFVILCLASFKIDDLLSFYCSKKNPGTIPGFFGDPVPFKTHDWMKWDKDKVEPNWTKTIVCHRYIFFYVCALLFVWSTATGGTTQKSNSVIVSSGTLWEKAY